MVVKACIGKDSKKVYFIGEEPDIHKYLNENYPTTRREGMLHTFPEALIISRESEKNGSYK